MSRISQIQAIVRSGLYYVTEHADDEAAADGFDVYSLRGQTETMKTMKARPVVFWEGEACEYCGGPIVEKRATLHRKVRGQYVLIENVPAGVCAHCGVRYYTANVLKTVEESLRGRRQAEREVLVPVYSL